jgi:hypothetical protein
MRQVCRTGLLPNIPIGLAYRRETEAACCESAASSTLIAIIQRL